MALCLGATDDARLHTLSGLLRAAFTALPPFDLAKAAADRDRWLHGRRSASVATVQSAPAWRELARGIPENTPGYSNQSAHYRRFLRAVSAALGGESPPDEVASAASLAFRALSSAAPVDEAPTEPPSRDVLQRARTAIGVSTFGSRGPPEEQLRVMLSCHGPLAAWLRQHRGAAGKGRAINGAVVGAEPPVVTCVPSALGARVIDEFMAAADEADKDVDSEDDPFSRPFHVSNKHLAMSLD